MTFLSKNTITFAFALIILSVFSMQARANDMGEVSVGEILETSDTMDIPITVDNLSGTGRLIPDDAYDAR